MATTALETPVRNAWLTLGYYGRGICRGCGELAHCYGTSPDTRVCVTCFEFKFDCKAPRRKR